MLITSGYDKLYLCHEYKEKKRCSNCGSLNTKKKGFITSKYHTNRGIINRKSQRFFCNDCQKSFNHNRALTRVRYSESIKKNSVKDYVITKNSLSEVSERYGISRTSILNWLPSESKTYQSILSLQQKLPKSGVIQIDGKEFKVAGERRVVLIATDAVSKQPFFYTVSKAENKLNSLCFLRAAKRVYGRSVKGIISDFGKGKCFVGSVNLNGSVLPFC
jgi:transposase-like protein